MTGTDLSLPMRGHKLPTRDYAYGGYANSFHVRTHRYALWGENRPGRFRLFDTERDPSYNHNLAPHNPGLVGSLYGHMAGQTGRPPFYGG
jgi:hypothetical protein